MKAPRHINQCQQMLRIEVYWPCITPFQLAQPRAEFHVHMKAREHSVAKTVKDLTYQGMKCMQ